MTRPYVLASAAVSLDGCLDDARPERLLLSSPEDFDAVDELRAGVDAVLVGAGTVRADDPRLLVRSAARRARRVGTGRPENPIRVVLSGGGALDPAAAIVTGGPPPLLYLPEHAVPAAGDRLGGRFEPVGAGDPLRADTVLADLAGRGVRRLLVEGGAAVHRLFLAAGVVDELRLAVAPVFVGDPAAPRFLGPGGGTGRRWRVVEVTALGDTTVTRYLPG